MKFSGKVDNVLIYNNTANKHGAQSAIYKSCSFVTVFRQSVGNGTLRPVIVNFGYQQLIRREKSSSAAGVYLGQDKGSPVVNGYRQAGQVGKPDVDGGAGLALQVQQGRRCVVSKQGVVSRRTGIIAPDVVIDGTLFPVEKEKTPGHWYLHCCGSKP